MSVKSKDSRPTVRVRKDVRATLPYDRRCVLGCLLNRSAEHSGVRSGSPTGRPHAPVAGCAQKPAGLKPGSAQLPPSEDRLNHPRSSAEEPLAFPDRQFPNRKHVGCMGDIIIR